MVDFVVQHRRLRECGDAKERVQTIAPLLAPENAIQVAALVEDVTGALFSINEQVPDNPTALSWVSESIYRLGELRADADMGSDTLLNELGIETSDSQAELILHLEQSLMSCFKTLKTGLVEESKNLIEALIFHCAQSHIPILRDALERIILSLNENNLLCYLSERFPLLVDNLIHYPSPLSASVLAVVFSASLSAFRTFILEMIEAKMNGSDSNSSNQQQFVNLLLENTLLYREAFAVLFEILVASKSSWMLGFIHDTFQNSKSQAEKVSEFRPETIFPRQFYDLYYILAVGQSGRNAIVKAENLRQSLAQEAPSMALELWKLFVCHYSIIQAAMKDDSSYSRSLVKWFNGGHPHDVVHMKQL